MKILETEQGWAVEHNGIVPVTVEGTEYFTDKRLLTTAVEKRGMYIWVDGSIEPTPEVLVVPPAKSIDDDAFEAAAPKDSSGAPPTQDPPVDPDADKDRPKPSPKPTAPGNKKRAPAKKKTAPTTEPARGRGRPRIYTPEEAAQRRREKSREYASNRSDEQKAAARERARKWREEHPEEVKAAREKSMAKRAERYEKDPTYRAKFNEYQREYKRSQRKAD